MKKIVFGLLLFYGLIQSSSAENIVYLSGYVPQVQRFHVERSLSGLEMKFKHNSKTERPKLTVEVYRKDQVVDSRELYSRSHSLFYEDTQEHPIQKVTLIQH